ncbi:MAG: redox-regulated ATPase YchF [Candidatus Aminicenantales bacterium]
MNFTLFGYPKTGKTTLFNLLTGEKRETAAYESGIKEPVFSTCRIPDSRLEKIWSLYPEKKKVPASIDYTDLAGISFGEVKNSAYLSHLRTADGLTHVVRGFSEPKIPHPKGRINPEEDISSMEEELILADLLSLETRLAKLDKELKRKKSAEGEKEKELLARLQLSLEDGKAVREVELSPSEEKLIRSFTLLSFKPLLHMVNVDEKDIPLIETPEKFYPRPKKGTAILAFCGKIESEILELEEEEKQLFLSEYGLKELSISKFLRASYALLRNITFFTVGKEEVKAWTLKENTPAVEAAGAIHTDIKKGFIKAEVISWERLIEHGSLQKAKEKGALRLEGKDYIIQDGDVVYFRFSA